MLLGRDSSAMLATHFLPMTSITFSTVRQENEIYFFTSCTKNFLEKTFRKIKDDIPSGRTFVSGLTHGSFNALTGPSHPTKGQKLMNGTTFHILLVKNVACFYFKKVAKIFRILFRDKMEHFWNSWCKKNCSSKHVQLSAFKHIARNKASKNKSL